METRCVVIEIVDAIQGEHVEVNIEIQGRPKSPDEGDDAGSGTALTGETGTVDKIGFAGSGNDPKRS